MDTIYITCVSILGGAFLGYYGVELLFGFDALQADDNGIFEIGIFNAIMAAFFTFERLQPRVLTAPSSVLGGLGALFAVLFATCMFVIFIGYTILISPSFSDTRPLEGDYFDASPVLFEMAAFCVPLLLVGLVALLLLPVVSLRNARVHKQEASIA